MLCADFLNTLYKLKINRTFIEHKKNSSIKKSKKCTYINMEVEKKIDPLGFREYDARWLYPKSINSKGIEAVGKGFGTQVISSEKNPIVIVGNDYRSYSEEVKNNFGINLEPIEDLSNLDSIIVAVAHNEFCEMKPMDLKKLCLQKKVAIADVKSIYKEEDLIKEGFDVFRL